MTPEDQLADKHRAEIASLPSADAQQVERALIHAGGIIMMMSHENAVRVIRMLTELEATVSR